jgi:hypothetical protein
MQNTDNRFRFHVTVNPNVINHKITFFCIFNHVSHAVINVVRVNVLKRNIKGTSRGF